MRARNPGTVSGLPIRAPARAERNWWRNSERSSTTKLRYAALTSPNRSLDQGRSMSAVELAKGLEPPTCRLQGRSSPTSMSRAGRIAQLRKADRQGRDGSGKGGTLAETLAEQSKLCSGMRRSDDPRLVEATY